MEEIRNWLNGARTFEEGVRLYTQYGKDAVFIHLIAKGQTPYNSKLMFEKMEELFYSLKNKAQVVTETPAVAIAPVVTIPVIEAPVPAEDPAPCTGAGNACEQSCTTGSCNNVLLEACKQTADKLYKELMGVRAKLFALCTVTDLGMDSEPNLVSQRKKFALEIMDMQYQVDEAYFRYNHVKDHGRLPESEPAPQAEQLPENPIMLERKRANLKKSINKDKAKEQTPVVIARLQDKYAQLKMIDEKISGYIGN